MLAVYSRQNMLKFYTQVKLFGAYRLDKVSFLSNFGLYLPISQINGVF